MSQTSGSTPLDMSEFAIVSSSDARIVSETSGDVTAGDVGLVGRFGSNMYSHDGNNYFAPPTNEEGTASLPIPTGFHCQPPIQVDGRAAFPASRGDTFIEPSREGKVRAMVRKISPCNRRRSPTPPVESRGYVNIPPLPHLDARMNAPPMPPPVRRNDMDIESAEAQYGFKK